MIARLYELHHEKKNDFFICKYESEDQLGYNRAADQCLCFCYIDCTILLHVLRKSDISSLWPSVVVQLRLCRTV